MPYHKKVTKEEFIKRLKELYPNAKADYSKVILTKITENATVRCPVHGDVTKLATTFLSGSGIISFCKNCNKEENRLQKEKVFIADLKKLFGDKYSYDKVYYTDLNKDITLICPIHREFPKRAFRALEGKGCNDCYYESTASTTEEFIKKAKDKHGDTHYDYSKVVYIRSNIDVTIKCNIHNKEFPIKPNSHLRGSGCYLCGREKTKESLRKDVEIFKAEAREVHDGLYTYENVNYENSHTHVLITCPNNSHPDFPQSPTSHLWGAGCPLCHLESKMSKGEKKVLKILESKGLNIDMQYTFDDCRNILPLPFDFVVFDKENNISFLIEVDGRQHREPVCYGGISYEEAEENLAKTIHNDNIKTRYCRSKSYDLVRINDYELHKSEKIIDYSLIGKGIL